MKESEYYAEWTGFSNCNRCYKCGETDKETLEYDFEGHKINICKDCEEVER